MGSAIGNMGMVKFDRGSKTPQVVKATTQYIASIAGAIAAVTGDPQLKQIGDKLGRLHQPGHAMPMPTQEQGIV